LSVTILCTTANSSSSLVGHQGIASQHELVKAIPHTDVQLFVPSDLSYKVESDIMKIPALRAKAEVEQAAKNAGISMTIVCPGNLVESTFATPSVPQTSSNWHEKLISACLSLVGIDCQKNRIVYSGNSEHEKLNLW
jgi:hypothetical protein